MFKKRLMLSLLMVAAISMLVAGSSLALFSASTSNIGNTFTAGNVSLGQTPVLIPVERMVPGDTNAQSLDITYTGNVDAWLGVDYDATGALFEDSANGDVNHATATLSCEGQNFTANAPDTEVVGTAPVAPSAVKSFTLTTVLPLEAGNDFQGTTGTVNMVFKAVQARNNTNGAGTGPNAWQ